MSANSTFLYPNVTSVPVRNDTDAGRAKPDKSVVPGEFDNALDQALSAPQAGAPALQTQPGRPPLKFSAHSIQRMSDRNITLDPATMSKLGEAVDKAAVRGVQDTLVLTKDAALIVNTKNRTVVTVMDRQSLNGNVFTNIDGAVIV